MSEDEARRSIDNSAGKSKTKNVCSVAESKTRGTDESIKPESAQLMMSTPSNADGTRLRRNTQVQDQHQPSRQAMISSGPMLNKIRPLPDRAVSVSHVVRI